MKTDRDHIIYLKQDDYHAFDELFSRYSENVFAFVFSISKDSFVAEEVTQTVFVKIWEKRMQIDEHFSFKSFLFRITYNETISYLRKEKAEKRRIELFTSSKSFSSNETEYLVEFQSQNLARETIEVSRNVGNRFLNKQRAGLTNKESHLKAKSGRQSKTDNSALKP